MKTNKSMGYAQWVGCLFATGAAILICGTLARAQSTAPATAPATMSCCDAEPATQPVDPLHISTFTFSSGGGGLVYAAQVSPAGPATDPAPAGPVAATPGVLDALKRLHDVDAGLDTFTASAQKIDTDPRSGDETRLGTVYYQKDGTKTNLALQIDKYVVPGGGVPALKKDEKIAFVPPFLIRQDNVKKEYSRDEVVKPGAVVAPLKAGSGFPPLPIGQEPADLLKEFDITEVPLAQPAKLPKGTNAADVIVLKLVPRVAKAYDFAQVQLVVDKKLNLPVVIEQTKPDGNLTTLVMDKVEINKLPAGTAKTVFDTTPPGPPWKVTLTPYK